MDSRPNIQTRCRLRKASRPSILILFFLIAFSDTLSQIRLMPAAGLERPKGIAAQKNDNASGRTKDTGPLTLPFWDDFSTPYGPYPDTNRWVNSHGVWINDGMGLNQPTINVATLEGLDQSGNAYNPVEVLVTGYTDTLTSREIDLGETAITAAERSGVFLSFYYQWQGNGEAPDSDDFLELEFRDSTDAWNSIARIFPLDDMERDVFYDTVIAVGDGKYFHDAFQFRFRSFGRQSGPFDTWNIDYVYLNKNRTANDTSFPERAAASDLTRLFGDYTAVPYRHFLLSPLMENVTFDVANLKNDTVSINYRASAVFTNYRPADTIRYSRTLVASEGVKGTSGLMFAKERTTVTVSGLPNPSDPLQFDPSSEAVDVTLKVRVISSDSLETGRSKFLPYNLQVNDTVSQTYRMHDYYAYDDGVAEYSAGLIEPGDLIAYRFDMIASTEDTIVADTLIGFEIYFPPYAISNNQTVNFYVYHDSNGEPGNIWQSVSLQRIENKGLNTFQRIVWTPALLINERSFYIGWKQPVTGDALVGLDIDNDTGDRIFVNTTSEWYQNQNVRGSLMIRPLFGGGPIDQTVGVEETSNPVTVYPNPSTGVFQLDGRFNELKLFDVTGKPVPFGIERNAKQSVLTVGAPSGLYLLRIRSGKTWFTEKLVILR